MSALVLVKPNEKYINEIRNYRQEFIAHESHIHGTAGLSRYEDIPAWITRSFLFEKEETKPEPERVTGEQFMLMQEGENRILGMINLRHYLNDAIAEWGGHIGYSVRPTERRKGYGKAMLMLCLEECRRLGLDRVLITCDSDNEASFRTVESCGGKFERMTQDDNGKETARYWITLAPLAHYYNNRDEEKRLASKHGQIEFLTTMRYIERYLTPGAKVIEIGASTGRYSRAIAGMGHSVDAVELFQHNIDIFREYLSSGQYINIIKGDALNLSAYADNTFDVTLLLGPLYHLYTLEDKQQAISEALRVTKPNGIVFAAYCISDASIVQSGFNHKRYDIIDFVKKGKINADTFDTFSAPEDVFELVRKDDIDSLMKCFNTERLHYVGVDLFSHFIGEAIDEMDDEVFALYLRYHYAVCERADLVGITNHALDVFRKLSS